MEVAYQFENQHARFITDLWVGMATPALKGAFLINLTLVEQQHSGIDARLSVSWCIVLSVYKQVQSHMLRCDVAFGAATQKHLVNKNSVLVH